MDKYKSMLDRLESVKSAKPGPGVPLLTEVVEELIRVVIALDREGTETTNRLRQEQRFGNPLK